MRSKAGGFASGICSMMFSSFAIVVSILLQGGGIKWLSPFLVTMFKVGQNSHFSARCEAMDIKKVVILRIAG
jgi:hypothetical protein